jgi:hypothetical protein
MSRDADDQDAATSPKDAAADVSVLDHALWSRFTEDRDLKDFAKVWLALQIRQVAGVTRGVVVLEAADGGGLIPVAVWPNDTPPTQELSTAIEAALDREGGANNKDIAIATPILLDGEVIGAAALELETPSRSASMSLLRQLQWGVGWLTAAVRRDVMLVQSRDRAGMAGVLDIIGATLDNDDVASAALATANLAARKLNCAQVAIGFQKRGRLRLKTLSDVSDFRLNTDRTRMLEAAMEEAYFQEGTVLYPPRPGQGFVAALAHRKFAEAAKIGEVITVPLFANDGVLGAISFQKPAQETFSDTDLVLAEGIAAAVGPILADKTEKGRSVLVHAAGSLKTQIGRVIGHGYLGRKLAVLVLGGVVVFFAVAQSEFRVTADAEVQGLVVRSLTASYDGHVDEAFFRAGDIVAEGDVLASLDDRDLRIELLRWQTDLRRYQSEYDRALAERDASEVLIAAANIDQSQAKIDLVQLQLNRAEILAPFDGIVIEGDLSQSLGTAVRRGEVMFRIAPLDEYRVALEVDETNLDEIVIGQHGQLILSSLPDESYAFEVTQITPKLQAANGRNYAIVEALLEEGSDEIRPGMRGVGKVSVAERLMIRNWTQPMIDWARLALWKWMP